MSQELTLSQIKAVLPHRQAKLITQDTLNEINKLAKDSDYGEDFIDLYRDHLNILVQDQRRNSDKYLQAIKFFYLIEGGLSLTDAYILVFPERYEARRASKRDFTKADMTSEGSRFNATKMVNDIRKAATVPIQLIHRHTLYEAIAVEADIMRNAKSELVRQKAAAHLIDALKPAEEQVLSIQVEDGSKSAIEELRLATSRLASAQFDRIHSGTPVKDIAESVVITIEAENG